MCMSGYALGVSESVFVCTCMCVCVCVCVCVCECVCVCGSQGVWQSEQVDYDVLPDEERQCAQCRTTCFLSALTCPCSPALRVCLHHIHHLCSCSPTA